MHFHFIFLPPTYVITAPVDNFSLHQPQRTTSAPTSKNREGLVLQHCKRLADRQVCMTRHRFQQRCWQICSSTSHHCCCKSSLQGNADEPRPSVQEGKCEAAPNSHIHASSVFANQKGKKINKLFAPIMHS